MTEQDRTKEELIIELHELHQKFNSLNEFLAEDSTLRKQAVETMQNSASEFRSLAESMPQIVWITSADGRNISNQQCTMSIH